MAAFADAMRQVLPLSKLLVFTTSELLESVCGEAVHWDEQTVRECIVSYAHNNSKSAHSCDYMCTAEFA